jgi:1,6-anhydro-N-acetylmuramate kinase
MKMAKRARSGTVDDELVQAFMAHPYFSQLRRSHLIAIAFAAHFQTLNSFAHKMLLRR